MDETTAIHIVAMDVLARMADDDIEDEWENYPEIGEDDWERVCDEARRIAPREPNKADYEEAYKLLTARAEGNNADSKEGGQE